MLTAYLSSSNRVQTLSGALVEELRPLMLSYVFYVKFWY